MGKRSLLGSAFNGKAAAHNQSAFKSRSLRIEMLEERALLAVDAVACGCTESSQFLNAPVESVCIAEEDISCSNAEIALADVSATGWNSGKRWFYVDDLMDQSWNYTTRSLIVSDGSITGSIDRAKQMGLNGMVWKCYVEDVEVKGDTHRINYLGAVKEYARVKGIEIIPTIWAVGYSSLLLYNANFVEGVPVKNVPLVVGNGQTSFSGETGEGVAITNCGMESWNGNVPNFWAKDDPTLGYTSKSTDRHTGSYSLQIAPATTPTGGLSTKGVYQSVGVQIGGSYTASCWVKISTSVSNPYNAAEFQIVDANDRPIAYQEYKRADPNYVNNGWVQLTTDVFTPQTSSIEIRLKGTGNFGEKFWFDDVALSVKAAATDGVEFPIIREGTPIVVKSSKDPNNCIIYNKGTDWRLPAGYELKYNYQDGNIYVYVNGTLQPTGEINLVIPSGSRLKAGDTIYVDYYTPKSSSESGSYKQYGVCLSEPGLYEAMEHSAGSINDILSPKTWFLAFDEVRIGGNCAGCHSTGLTTAQIFGKSVAKQYEIIKSASPDAEIVVWSDMFDPNLNAKDEYYDVDGSLTDVVDYIPNDMIIACWYDWKDQGSVEQVCVGAKASLTFFADRGFRTMGSTFYDWDNVYPDMPTNLPDYNTQGWLRAIEELNAAGKRNNVGVMYTTWENEYKYLNSFAASLPAAGALTNLTNLTLNTNAPKVGVALTASSTPPAATLSYQWYRKARNAAIDMDVWKSIDGATQKTYTPTSADVNSYLKVVAVGTGSYAGTLSATTSQRVTVGTDPNTFHVDLSTNSPRYNVSVKATSTSASAAYQWYRVNSSGTATTISGATKASYLPKADDVGYYLRVVATGSGVYANQTSTATTANKVTRPIISVTLPKTVEYNRILTASLSPAAATAAYTWYRGNGVGNWTKITTKTSPNYVPTQADVGFYLKVVATGTGNYTGEYERVTSTVVTRNLTSIVMDAAGNDPVEGKRITSYISPGTATVAYQWYRVNASGAATAISGARSYRYAPTAADAGCYLKVVATGTGAYTGVVEKTTANPMPVTLSVRLSTDEPAYNALLRTTIAPNLVDATYRWFRSSSSTGGWSEIAGATARSYLPCAADVGCYLKVEASGFGEYESIIATDVTANKVTRPIISVALPKMVEYNRTLTAFQSPGVATAAYTWYRGDGVGGWTEITTRTTPKYVPTQADVGYYLKVVVTGTGSYTGTQERITSTLVTRPILSVTLNAICKQGRMITSYPSPGIATASYQWYRGPSIASATTAIPGATSKTYVPTFEDVGYYLKVVVTGTGCYTREVSRTTSNPIAASTTGSSALFADDTDELFPELDTEFDEFWDALR